MYPIGPTHMDYSGVAQATTWNRWNRVQKLSESQSNPDAPVSVAYQQVNQPSWGRQQWTPVFAGGYGNVQLGVGPNVAPLGIGPALPGSTYEFGMLPPRLPNGRRHKKKYRGRYCRARKMLGL